MEATDLTRPEAILQAFGSRHPAIWREITRSRETRDWPDWCYVPVSVAHVPIARKIGVPIAPLLRAGLRSDPAVLSIGYDAGIASTLAAWRMGRGVYRFDADFSAALTATPLSGDLPVEVLYHLPEWAVYVEMDRPPARGFFCSLEWDRRDGAAELRLLFDVGDDRPLLLPLPLTATTIAGMLGELEARIRRNAADMEFDAAPVLEGYAVDGDLGVIIRDVLQPALNLLIYLCSPEAEYRGGVRPGRPATIKTRRGERLFPAATPRVWRLGEDIGARLRAASADRNLPEERNAPRPHLRRAHWHTYRVGKGRAGYRPRWLHPILVGYRDNNDAAD